MNTESQQVLQPPPSISAHTVADPKWRTTLPLVGAACVAILFLYWPTAASLVAIWERSETFAHGFLILPISLFLIWRRRREVAKLTPSADPLGFVLLAGAGAAWLVASAGQVQIVQQYAMVAMLPAAVVALAGREVARALLFPLAFLFLGVPIGESLVPPLMDWTADFTVTALQLSGIPVFREGTFFTIPSGHWSVVEGCSGLRYLIASITVGVLFAYLNYTKLSKRLLFVLASIIVPIIANGLRAYMIVMIAHLSDMKLALGVDHLIYGWVFFGIVMLLLFWVGSFWRDPVPTEKGEAGETTSGAMPMRRHPVTSGVAVVAALAVAAVWPAYAAWLYRDPGANADVATLTLPAPAAGWKIDPVQVTDWRPHYEGARASLFQTYRKGDRTVALYLGYYEHQQRGEELVTSTNIMIVQKHPIWSNVSARFREENLGHGPVNLRETRLNSASQRLLIWDWNRIAGRDLTNPYLAKLLLARDRLLGRGDTAAAVILATPYDEQTEAAAATLREFARDMLPSIDAALARAGRDSVASAR